MLQKYRECHMDSKLSSIVIFMGKAHGLELPLKKFVQFGPISWIQLLSSLPPWDLVDLAILLLGHGFTLNMSSWISMMI